MILLLLAICLLAGWIRSCYSGDRLHARIWDRQSIILDSRRGRIMLLLDKSDTFLQPVNGLAGNNWEALSYPVKSVPLYCYDPNGSDLDPASPQADGMAWPGAIEGVWIQPTEDLVGLIDPWVKGVMFPYWFLFLVTSVTGYVLILPRFGRFGLRSLFVVMTLIGVVLGLIDLLDR